MIKYCAKTQTYHLERKYPKIESFAAPMPENNFPKKKFSFTPEHTPRYPKKAALVQAYQDQPRFSFE